ncbi:MAG: ABC transporter permease, partial [Verrucomicrobia bacterium]|nr:ABC transporter permease [Verrucomicrobiota bacterium]
WGDYVGSFLALLMFCIPGFVVGPILALVFAIELGWFPVALWLTPMHVVLPTVALGLYFAGRVSRLMREGMTEALREPFIVTARSKGLSEGSVVFKHALRIAILPVISYSGPLLADLLTGSFVVENLFRVPGIGVFLVNAALGRDYNMVVGLALVYAFLLVVLNLAVDVGYAFLDRRVKHG